MKRLLSIFIFLVAAGFLINSCEDIVENPGLPYEKQLVIRAIIENGKPVTGLTITRTFPPLERYDTSKIKIRDAKVVIEYNGVEYTLLYDYNNEWYYNGNLIPVIGGKYSLRVEWGGMAASAVTTIPDTFTINSFNLKVLEPGNIDEGESQSLIINANINPRFSSVYIGGLYTQYNFYRAQDYAMRYSDTLKNGTLNVPIHFGEYWDKETIDTNLIKSNRTGNLCVVESYDPQFYDYYITRNEGSSSDEIFGSAGINVRGNIKGGIGLFIGRTVVKKNVIFE